MRRMPGFLKGRPKIIKEFQPEKYDGYFICVKIKKFNKRYKFPLASYKGDGVRVFTNDLEGRVLYLDKTALEDLIKYQQVEYEFINGYYYDEGFQPKINEVIQHIFNQRLKFKNEHNPIEMVFKECMNSSYGKSYMKPIDTIDDYIKVKDFDKFMDRNFNYIQEATLLANEQYYKIKRKKPIDEHFNNVHVGVSILSMTKRIMNEVMCLAEDLDIKMYYTDTDSIHIEADKIDLLASEFQKIHKRELIGNQLGQFHTDFDMEGSKKDSEIVSVESYFLGKKCYIDKLESVDKDDNIINDFHIRNKGVPTDCIIHKAENTRDINDDLVYKDVMDIYDDLFEGNSVNFNLLAVRPKFEMCKNMMIITRQEFYRNIIFKGEGVTIRGGQIIK